jgi:hypothetical protein
VETSAAMAAMAAYSTHSTPLSALALGHGGQGHLVFALGDIQVYDMDKVFGE